MYMSRSISYSSPLRMRLRPHPLDLASRFDKLMSLFALWQRRSHQRGQLLQLNDRLLQDIGLSRTDALAEASKPFWRA